VINDDLAISQGGGDECDAKMAQFV